MSGIVWLIFTFVTAGVFLILMTYRVLKFKRQPEHLRWELAPVPHDKGKTGYGGSHLEDYEWWQKPRRRARLAPFIYMAHEIFLMRGVWKNNRSLWPFSFALHIGLYLFIMTLVLYFVNSLLLITGTQQSLLNTFYTITGVVTAAGCVLGSLGALGLILKRFLDVHYRSFSSFFSFFKLVFLAAVFVSGGFALIYVHNYPAEMARFTRDILTLNTGIQTSTISSAHIIISMLFIIYLPFTDMVHFVTKFFTYHGVRWNDMPRNKKMEERLSALAGQTIGWSAVNEGAEGKRSWADLADKSGGRNR
jgi:nitrate reductase gamma subunit